MMSGVKRRIWFDVMDNKAQYLLLVFFLLVGIAAGTFYISNLEGGSKKELSEYINLLFITIKYNSIDYFSIFISSFLQNAIFFAIITLFSLSVMGIPVIAATLVFKGFCVGFTVGVLSLNIGAGGFLAIVVCTFLPNLVLLPCICRAAVLGLNQSVIVIKCRRIPTTARDKVAAARPYLIKILQAYLISLAGVALETLLTPALMMLI